MIYYHNLQWIIVKIWSKIFIINVLMSVFPACKIYCCRFQLAQSWWRKIQTVGLSSEYKDKSCEIGKWSSQFFGFPFLPAEEIEDCFVEDILMKNVLLLLIMYLIHMCLMFRVINLRFRKQRGLRTVKESTMVQNLSILTIMNNFIHIIQTSTFSLTL